MPNKQRLEVKNIKTFRGHDGVGLNATLYFDGKKVCDVLDDAHGGEWEFNWIDGYHTNSKVAREVEAYVETQPTKFCSVNMSASHLMDSPHHDRADGLKCPKCGTTISESEGMKRDDDSLCFVGDLFCKKCNCIYEFMGADLESFINLRVEENEIAKTFKRKCKTHTLIRRQGFSDTEYLEFKVPYTPALKPKIMAKYPDCIEIINERYL